MESGAEVRAAALLELAKSLAGRPALPGREPFAALVAEVLDLLRSEPAEVRPPDAKGLPGGLVLLPPVPTVLVPDLHARVGLLAEILQWRPPIGGRTDAKLSHAESAAADLAGADLAGAELAGADLAGADLAALLSKGEASLVCLGDAFHSESGDAAKRWPRAHREYASGWERHEAMDDEMARALSTIKLVLECKRAFPAAFHYLKGNHDNIANDSYRGDRPFYKFADEGAMAASWFVRTYGAELLSRYRALELELPLAVLGDRFAASHGEPAFPMRPADLVEYRSREDVVYGLIWTGNGEAAEGAVEESLRAFFQARAEGARWFGGHRPVSGRFALRANGRYVQIHDPSSYRVALLLPGRDPEPERDVLVLG